MKKEKLTTQKNQIPAPSRKLFAVKIGSISKDSDGWDESLGNAIERVVAVDAVEAIKKVKLSSSKDYSEFICGVEFISNIDRF